MNYLLILSVLLNIYLMYVVYKLKKKVETHADALTKHVKNTDEDEDLETELSTPKHKS